MNYSDNKKYTPPVFKALLTVLFVIIPAMMFLLKSYGFRYSRIYEQAYTINGNLFQFFQLKFGDDIMATCVILVVICSIAGLILTWANKPKLIIIPSCLYLVVMACSVHISGEYIYHFNTYINGVLRSSGGIYPNPSPAYWIIWISIVTLIIIDIVAIRKTQSAVSFSTSTASAVQSQPADPSLDQINKLKQLKQLLDDGALTQEEYDSKKKQFLEGK